MNISWIIFFSWRRLDFFSISGQSLRVLETKFGMLQRNVGCFNEKNKNH